MGHHDQYVPTSPSVGCAFGQETFAGMHGNGEEAPIPDLPTFTPEPGAQPLAVVGGCGPITSSLDGVIRGAYCATSRPARRILPL